MDRGFLSNTELKTPGGRLVYFFGVLFLLLVAIAALFPFFYALTSGLKGSTEIFTAGLNLLPNAPQWENYEQAWTLFNIPRLFKNSFVVVTGSVLIRVTISASAAYSLSQLNPKFGNVVMMGFLITLMIPAIAYIVPLYLTIQDVPLVHLNLLDSYWGLWLPYVIDAFAIFVFKTFFDRIPREIVDSARIDGASPLQILMYIILPLSRSIIIVICVISFVNIWRDFLLPLLVIKDPAKQPITVRLIYIAERHGVNIQMAASFLALLPPLLIAIVLQRYMRVNLSAGGVKG